MNFNLPRQHTIARHLVDKLVDAGPTGLSFTQLSRLYTQYLRKRNTGERHHEINVGRILKRYATKLGPPHSHTNWVANQYLDNLIHSFITNNTIYMIA